jgi:hypothetical protein
MRLAETTGGVAPVEGAARRVVEVGPWELVGSCHNEILTPAHSCDTT